MFSKNSAEGARDVAAADQAPVSVSGVSRDSVLGELDKVLRSPSFRTSRQCQRFLRHVVERTLDGDEDSLHERCIGRELFDRKPDYDPSADPVVRVRAGEIRKRLAQYYLESGAESPLRVELPVGSYCARFVPTAPAASPVSAEPLPVRRSQTWIWVSAAVILVVAIVAGLVASGNSKEPALEAFWEPVFKSTRPTVICSGHPVVYFLSARVHDRYRKAQNGPTQPAQGPYVIPLAANEAVEGRDIVPVTDQYIGAGDGVVAARLAGFFGRYNKDWQLRFGNDLSFTDLRSAPAVLIGAFSNRWTLSLTDKLRFVFDFSGGVKRIVDRTDSARQWALPDIAPDGRVTHDYAIVSRIFQSETGEMLISAAGITQYGTQATAEFLVNNDLIASAVKSAPADWKKRNLQVILHTKVVGRTSGPPEIVAAHAW